MIELVSVIHILRKGADWLQVDLANKSFDKLPTESGTTAVSDQVRDHKFTGSDARFIDSSMDEIHFAMAFESVGWTHPDSVVFMVMQSLLGQWDTKCVRTLFTLTIPSAPASDDLLAARRAGRLQRLRYARSLLARAQPSRSCLSTPLTRTRCLILDIWIF